MFNQFLIKMDFEIHILLSKIENFFHLITIYKKKKKKVSKRRIIVKNSVNKFLSFILSGQCMEENRGFVPTRSTYLMIVTLTAIVAIYR